MRGFLSIRWIAVSVCYTNVGRVWQAPPLAGLEPVHRLLLAVKLRSRAGTYLRRLKFARIHRRFSGRLSRVTALVDGGTMPS
jgi:hypothetical protein